MSQLADEVYDRKRGADGFFPPHPDSVTRAQIAENARHIAGEKPAMQRCLPDGKTITWYLMPDEPLSIGPRLYWMVTSQGEVVIAAGLFERDEDFEEERQQTTGVAQVYWVAQSACVLPEFQRQGIYSAVLRETSRLTGVQLLPDTQQTRASAGVWAKVASELGADTASQEEK